MNQTFRFGILDLRKGSEVADVLLGWKVKFAGIEAVLEPALDQFLSISAVVQIRLGVLSRGGSRLLCRGCGTLSFHILLASRPPPGGQTKTVVGWMAALRPMRVQNMRALRCSTATIRGWILQGLVLRKVTRME